MGLGLMLVAEDVNMARRGLRMGKEEADALLVDHTIEFAAFVAKELGQVRYTPVRAINGRASSRGHAHSRSELLDEITLEQRGRNFNTENY